MPFRQGGTVSSSPLRTLIRLSGALAVLCFLFYGAQAAKAQMVQVVIVDDPDADSRTAEFANRQGRELGLRDESVQIPS